MSGLPPATSNGLGVWSVSGRMRSPRPAARIIAFISWDEDQEIDWVVRYWEKARAAGLPVREDFGAFWREYELMGLQRHLKVLGIFCRLKYRDGKDKYVEDLPRFINYARKTASRYLQLKPLQNLLDRLEGNTEQIGYRYK